jgi:hypothetical protein
MQWSPLAVAIFPSWMLVSSVRWHPRWEQVLSFGVKMCAV